MEVTRSINISLLSADRHLDLGNRFYIRMRSMKVIIDKLFPCMHRIMVEVHIFHDHMNALIHLSNVVPLLYWNN